MRRSCNRCARSFCTAARKEQMIWLEMSGLNVCFVPPKRRTWKFPDLVSRVVIKNPNNPVIGMLRNYV